METNWHHVVPRNDTHGHLTSGKECECQPRINADDLLIVHNAYDNREFDEIAESIANA
jgi:hypothetical protein